jgi:uncharacterized protein (TIGR03435 family)
MPKKLWAAALILMAAAAQDKKFEAASVKLTAHGRDAQGWSRSSLGLGSPDRLVGTNSSMAECLRWAFQIKDYQLIGPAWLNDDNASYDIEAKAPAGTTRKEMPELLQALLAERFGLKYHREERMLPSYELVVAKNGPKRMTPATGADAGHSSTKSIGGHVTATSISMNEWAYQLARYTKMPVFDKTGITGAFNFKLDYEGDSKEEGQPTLFTALQEQLGLKLETVKRPVDVIVVDHVERIPSGN